MAIEPRRHPRGGHRDARPGRDAVVHPSESWRVEEVDRQANILVHRSRSATWTATARWSSSRRPASRNKSTRAGRRSDDVHKAVAAAGTSPSSTRHATRTKEIPAADVDKDGVSELVHRWEGVRAGRHAGASRGRRKQYRMKDGKWTSTCRRRGARSPRCARIQAGDVNGDGKIDLVAGGTRLRACGLRAGVRRHGVRSQIDAQSSGFRAAAVLPRRPRRRRQARDLRRLGGPGRAAPLPPARTGRSSKTVIAAAHQGRHQLERQRPREALSAGVSRTRQPDRDVAPGGPVASLFARGRAASPRGATRPTAWLGLLRLPPYELPPTSSARISTLRVRRNLRFGTRPRLGPTSASGAARSRRSPNGAAIRSGPRDPGGRTSGTLRIASSATRSPSATRLVPKRRESAPSARSLNAGRGRSAELRRQRVRDRPGVFALAARRTPLPARRRASSDFQAEKHAARPQRLPAALPSPAPRCCRRSHRLSRGDDPEPKNVPVLLADAVLPAPETMPANPLFA